MTSTATPAKVCVTLVRTKRSILLGTKHSSTSNTCTSEHRSQPPDPVGINLARWAKTKELRRARFEPVFIFWLRVWNTVSNAQKTPFGVLCTMRVRL